jgi:hypothetical protein
MQRGAMMRIRMLSGCVAGGSAEITFTCDDELKDKIQARVLKSDGRVDLIALNGAEHLTLGSDAHTGVPSGHAQRRRAVVPLSPKTAVKSIDLCVYGFSKPIEIIKKPEFELSCLFFENDEAYEKSLFGRNRASRPKNMSTQLFVARQMVDFFEGSLYIKFGCATILAYRAIEEGDVISAKIALEAVKANLFSVNQLPFDPDYRKDRYHLYISMLTVRVHLSIFLKDWAGLIFCFEKIIKFLPFCSSRPPSSFVSFFNISRILTILFYCQISIGEHQKTAEILSVLKKTLSSAAMNIGWGNDLLEFADTCRILGRIWPHERDFLKKKTSPTQLSEESMIQLRNNVLSPALRVSNKRVMLEKLDEVLNVEAACQSLKELIITDLFIREP